MRESEKKGRLLGPLKDAPMLWKVNREYLEAWKRLNHSRPYTMGGPGFIPMSEILAYCELFQIDDRDERKKLARRIAIIDKPYLKATAKKAKAQRGKSSNRNRT